MPHGRAAIRLHVPPPAGSWGHTGLLKRAVRKLLRSHRTSSRVYWPSINVLASLGGTLAGVACSFLSAIAAAVGCSH